MDKKEKCCCFTGHRPEKLAISEEKTKKLLCEAIENAIGEGYTTFITGLAKGVDVWAGEIVIEYKNIYPDIKLVCALPFPKFSQNAPHIIQKADIIHTVCPYFSPYSFQQRNEWMVDNSSLVISVFTGEKGGTLNTVKYAEKKGVTIKTLGNPPLFTQIKWI